MTKTNKPMSRRMATLHKLSDAVNVYVSTPGGAKVLKSPPKIVTGKSLRARKSVLDTPVRFWASPAYLKALSEIALTFEVLNGVRPSQGVILRRALTAYAERLVDTVKDRDAMQAEARALGRHAKAA